MDLFPALREGALAVTGTSRLQRRLRFRYGQWRRQEQSAVWRRPAIASFDQWLKELWEQSLVRGGEAGRYALLPGYGSMILWERALEPDAVAGFDLEQNAALARSSWRQAQKYGLDVEALRREADGEDERRFARWAAHFEELRAQGNWLEEAALPGILTKDIQAGAVAVQGPVYLMGADEPLPAPQAGLLDALRACGTEIRPGPKAPLAQNICQLSYETGQEELEAAARWAEHGFCGIVMLDFNERGAAARQVLLNQLRPGWQMRGFPEDAPVNSAEAHPLSEFGPAEAALDALSLLPRRLDMGTVSRVLRGAYLRGARSEAGARARLESELRDSVVGTHIPRGQLLHRATRKAPMLAESLGMGRKASRPKDSKASKRSHRAWSAAFMAFLGALGWPGKRTLSSAEQQAVNAWNDVMARFGACDALSPQAVTMEQALSRLRAIAQERKFQPQGPDEAIELIPVSEAAGMHFSRLWVAGASASNWPRRSRPAPLLPLRVQRRLNMAQASPQSALDEARRQTQALMHAADELVFSWTKVAEGGVETTCSPLIAEVPTGKHEQVIGESNETAYPERLRCSAKLENAGDDAAPPRADKEKIKGGTRLLDTQLQSPFHAFAAHRLHARENPRAWDGLSALQRGQLLHKLMYCLYKKYADSDALNAALDEEAERSLAEGGTPSLPDALNGALDEAAESEPTDGGEHRTLEAISGLKKQLEEWASEIPKVEPLGLKPLVSGLLRMERERAVALALEWAQANAQHGDFIVERRERETCGKLLLGRSEPAADEAGTPDEPLGQGIELVLRLDRVDLTGSQEARIVLDYKTGGRLTLSAMNPGQLRASQLPAYALATKDAAAVAYIHLSDDPPAVIGIYDEARDKDLPYTKEKGLKPVDRAWRGWSEDWPKTLARWRAELDAAARRIQAGDARLEIFSKQPRQFEQYDILSRRHELERGAL